MMFILKLIATTLSSLIGALVSFCLYDGVD